MASNLRSISERTIKNLLNHEYKVLRAIEESPEMSQREMSKELGLSLGKVNYCVKALIEKGWVKANNFKNSKNKIAYAYLLTPEGVSKKSQLTRLFLEMKVREYETLQAEIDDLKKELEADE